LKPSLVNDISTAAGNEASSQERATDRSFVVALSRGLDVLRRISSQRRLLGNQRLRPVRTAQPTISRLTYTLTKLGYLTQFRGSRNINSRRSAMAPGVCRPCKSRRSAFVTEQFRNELMRQTGGACAPVRADRLSMIYFRPAAAAS